MFCEFPTIWIDFLVILASIFVSVQFSYEMLMKPAQGLLELISGYAPGMRQAFFDGRVFPRFSWPPMRRTVPCDAAAAYSFQTGSSKILANLQLKK